MAMSEMKASQFKAQCLSVLDHLDPEGSSSPSAASRSPGWSLRFELRPSDREHAGTFEVRGDLTTTGLKWDAES